MALSLLAGGAMANEHKLVFDGDNDMYGLVRQTSTDVNTIEFVPDFSFTEDGIEFSITKTSETGNGFALVNAGGNNAGIYVYSGFASSTAINPQITLSVPNGNITAVKLCMTGSGNNAALIALGVMFNGSEIDSGKNGTAYFWTWNSDEGAETVTIGWENKFYSRYIHSIEVTYTGDLGGKQECGLSFSEPSAEAFSGEPFTAPTLSNPNDLPLTWSSSDESVATVDAEGNVTPLSAGKTIITVSTEGNDKYAAGNTSYELRVIPTANNLVQLREVAPEVYDRVKVNFTLTVTFANGSYAFVKDDEDNAGCINDIRNQDNTSSTVTTIYKTGDVIPAGWVATNATIYESVIWEGIPDKVVETIDVEYPVVKAVTRADVDRVLTINNVTFTTYTASGNTKAYGTAPDGTRYEFQDTYGTPTYPAGTYDVTFVVRYSKRGTTEYFYLAPINYTESGSGSIDAVMTDSNTPRYFDLRGIETATPSKGTIYIKLLNGTATKELVK